MNDTGMASTRSQILVQCLILLSIVGGLTPVFGHRFSPTLDLIMRGLPTTVMLALAAFCPTSESPRYRWSIVVAFAFSQLGGYALGGVSFVTGVLTFLVANIAYLAAFTTDTRFAKRLVPFAIFGLLGASVLAMAWSSIPGIHRLPVLLYCMTIVSVPSQATTRYLTTRRIGTLFAAMGTSLLLISDSTIAIHRFYSSASWHDPFIMITYFVGQWLITMSVIHRPLQKSPTIA